MWLSGDIKASTEDNGGTKPTTRLEKCSPTLFAPSSKARQIDYHTADIAVFEPINLDWRAAGESFRLDPKFVDLSVDGIQHVLETARFVDESIDRNQAMGIEGPAEELKCARKGRPVMPRMQDNR